MKKGRPGRAYIALWVAPKEKERLEKEAKEQCLSLSAYVRRLIVFHPDRPSMLDSE